MVASTVLRERYRMIISKSKFFAGASVSNACTGRFTSSNWPAQRLLARQLFPGGWRSAGMAGSSRRSAQELIANPEVPGIFERASENDGVFVRVDILHRRPR